MHFLRRHWIPVAFYGTVAGLSALTAVETHMGRSNWGEAEAARVVHHDIEWYASHDDQRNAVKRWCVADTRNAKRSGDDCSNAFLADKVVASRAVGR
jgi:hypothetical protein